MNWWRVRIAGSPRMRGAKLAFLTWMGQNPGPAGRTRARWGGDSWARYPKKGAALQEKKGGGALPGVLGHP